MWRKRRNLHTADFAVSVMLHNLSRRYGLKCRAICPDLGTNSFVTGHGYECRTTFKQITE